MKRIWFGAALLCVMLILGLGSSRLMERIHMRQSEDLAHAAECAMEDNWAGAEKYLQSARREWNRNRALIAGLSDHEPMDQAEGLFAQLEIFVAVRDAVSFGSTCRYLSSQLEALGKSHSLILPNLF